MFKMGQGRGLIDGGGLNESIHKNGFFLKWRFNAEIVVTKRPTTACKNATNALIKHSLHQ